MIHRGIYSPHIHSYWEFKPTKQYVIKCGVYLNIYTYIYVQKVIRHDTLQFESQHPCDHKVLQDSTGQDMSRRDLTVRSNKTGQAKQQAHMMRLNGHDVHGRWAWRGLASNPRHSRNSATKSLNPSAFAIAAPPLAEMLLSLKSNVTTEVLLSRASVHLNFWQFSASSCDTKHTWTWAKIGTTNYKKLQYSLS